MAWRHHATRDSVSGKIRPRPRSSSIQQKAYSRTSLTRLIDVARSLLPQDVPHLKLLICLTSLAGILYYVTRKPVTLGHDYLLPANRSGIPQDDMHENGLLLATVGKRHPILTLIEKGERDWADLNAKQSKTLDQAVAEYKRRYHRNPPFGFDEWWRFVVQHKVALPDEYDFVDRDTLPFAALDPDDFKHRYRNLESRENTFVLQIQPDKIEVAGTHATSSRADEMKDLFSMFSAHLPSAINATFTIDDQPNILLDYERKAKMIELAREGEFFGPSEFFDLPSHDLSNFALACPPDSALRRSERREWVPELERQVDRKSFVHDAEAANDLCRHPEIKQLHGYTSGFQPDLTPLIPIMTFAKMQTHSDLLVTPLEQYWDTYLGNDPPFRQKTFGKVMWRGSTTGARFEVGQPWRESQRARLHFMGRSEEFGKRSVLWADEDGNSRSTDYDVEDLNQKYMDVSFAGEPAQCDEETCDLMEEIISFADTQSLDASYQYKYVIDVDGNGWSGRCHRLLWSNSLLLKSTVFPEWYSQRLIPWYHYVPIKVDYSDLYDVMAFFEGTPDGKSAHQELAERLALNGKRFAINNWRRVDMASYCFRLMLEMCRLLHPELGDYQA